MPKNSEYKYSDGNHLYKTSGGDLTRQLAIDTLHDENR